MIKKNKKIKKYHTVRASSKSNRKIAGTWENPITLINIYMTDHFPGLIKALHEKSMGSTSFKTTKRSLLMI